MDVDYRTCEYFFLSVNPECISSTSTTITTTTQQIIPCLEGLIIETLYFHEESDLSLIPSEYIHPCPETIGQHTCDRAFFEVYGNDIYMADSLLNNGGGTGGATTHSGKETCKDYFNTPTELTGGVWSGNPISRYSKTTLTHQQAIDIANAGHGGTTIELSFLAAMTLYSSICSGSTGPHNGVNWLRISTLEGTVLWNSCVQGNNIYSIDVCNGNVTTTTTTLVPTTTTTTTLVPTTTTTTTRIITTTTTTTLSPTTTTTTTGLPIVTSCGVFLVTPLGDVYDYEPTSGTCRFLMSTGVSAFDIANTETKLWTGNGSFFLQEYNITLNPFSYSFSRTITLPSSSGAGLTVKSANDGTGIYELIGGGAPSTIKNFRITPSSVTETILFTMGEDRGVTGDIIYNSTTNTCLISNNSGEGIFYITEYNIGDGSVINEIIISQTDIYGLYVYEGVNYAIGYNHAIYIINSSSISPIGTVPMIPGINGSSQNVTCTSND